MSLTRKITIYGLAALIAIAVNIGCQWLTVAVFGAYQIVVFASILVGTGAGLVSKYLLDKVFVFNEKIDSGVAKQFMLYSLTGVFTTLIFWSVELGFHFVFDAEHMRYIGGVVGLTIGYILKYIIDSRIVFTSDEPS